MSKKSEPPAGAVPPIRNPLSSAGCLGRCRRTIPGSGTRSTERLAIELGHSPCVVAERPDLRLSGCRSSSRLSATCRTSHPSGSRRGSSIRTSRPVAPDGAPESPRALPTASTKREHELWATPRGAITEWLAVGARLDCKVKAVGAGWLVVGGCASPVVWPAPAIVVLTRSLRLWISSLPWGLVVHQAAARDQAATSPRANSRGRSTHVYGISSTYPGSCPGSSDRVNSHSQTASRAETRPGPA